MGLELRKTGKTDRLTFGTEGEDKLSAWIKGHAKVAFAAHMAPWDIEAALIGSVSLPLNLSDNKDHSFHESLAALRSRCRSRARSANNRWPSAPAARTRGESGS